MIACGGAGGAGAGAAAVAISGAVVFTVRTFAHSDALSRGFARRRRPPPPPPIESH